MAETILKVGGTSYVLRVSEAYDYELRVFRDSVHASKQILNVTLYSLILGKYTSRLRAHKLFKASAEQPLSSNKLVLNPLLSVNR